ncbi:N-acetyl-1-D-myo-inositol-2-amino-2-deoxy-alpha-D-glucopyranoside deacetylase [Sciscionella sediminilitoris]|uniref:N-acetyl-1-D-myo-inositol-2-amino-2-deoxy-alpha- D-glucopyranoside deacetylase n=1 Tax=Sciscionella sediminilitoris TaxID=1445613 RepID=UPI0004DF465D|nr:N-acetyl-1-D-myo-inositol-2-amino-2-deoxy-alpha-D-glucopyranoside deacetylase [Sciscionella sp. SE31]
MTLTDPRRLLLVHAHPDDESIWTGGTIAKYAAEGAHVTVVTCTLGEEGEIIPDALAGLAADRADQLGGYRMGELRSACAALRVTEHRYLGGIGRWRDSGMVGDPANEHPRCFVRGSFDEQVAALAEVIAELRPQVVIGYDAFGGYGHPDHIRASEIAMAATGEDSGVARVFHTVNSRAETEAGLRGLRELDGLPYRMPAEDELHLTEDERIDVAVDVTNHIPAKLSALRAHATQVSVWQGSGAGECSYALSNGIAAPVLGSEFYVLAKGDRAGLDGDLFGGLS